MLQKCGIYEGVKMTDRKRLQNICETLPLKCCRILF